MSLDFGEMVFLFVFLELETTWLVLFLLPLIADLSCVYRKLCDSSQQLAIKKHLLDKYISTLKFMNAEHIEKQTRANVEL